MSDARNLLKGVRTGLVVLGALEIAVLIAVGGSREDLLRGIMRLDKHLRQAAPPENSPPPVSLPSPDSSPAIPLPPGFLAPSVPSLIP
jgi:hypothetical protein